MNTVWQMLPFTGSNQQKQTCDVQLCQSLVAILPTLSPQQFQDAALVYAAMCPIFRHPLPTVTIRPQPTRPKGRNDADF
jgi:hypothetical protein